MTRTRVRRVPDKARPDRAALNAVLDASLVAHVGIVDDGQPYVLPMACARDGDRLLLHGSRAAGSCVLADGAACCATVTLLDGLVYARSAFESSMNYRSAMVFGQARPVPDPLDALRLLTEHLLPVDGKLFARQPARNSQPPWYWNCRCRSGP